MSTNWVPVPSDHKFRFSQGYSKYAPYFGTPIPDWYWDPNPGQWLNLPKSMYDVTDVNWPLSASGRSSPPTTTTSTDNGRRSPAPIRTMRSGIRVRRSGCGSPSV